MKTTDAKDHRNSSQKVNGFANPLFPCRVNSTSNSHNKTHTGNPEN